MKRISCRFATVLTGIFFVIFGTGLILFGLRQITYSWAGEYLTLKNDSITVNRWIDPIRPSLFGVYIFNVTNLEEVNRGLRPKLTEVGPYVYEQTVRKIDLQTTKHPSVSYRLSSKIVFAPDDSGNLTESDEIVVVNVPLLNVPLSKLVEYFREPPQEKRNSLRCRRNIFLKTTVKEFLFDGIPINYSSTYFMESRGNFTRNPQHKMLRKIGKELRFSFFNRKNDSSEEVFAVDPGILNVENSPRILSIDNSTELNIWMDSYCDMINGSDGLQFSMPLSEKRKLYWFEGDICRSVYVEFEKVVEDGEVDLYRYVATENLFASGEANPANECYCRRRWFDGGQGSADMGREVTTKKKEGESSENCLGNGLLSLLPCTGLYLVASFPHFYLGDEKYVKRSGLTPFKYIHETYFDVEPNYGITVRSCKRFQFNVDVKKTTGLGTTSRFPGPEDEIFPVLWTEEKTTISNEFRSVLRFGLILRKTLKYGSIGLIALGFVLVLSSQTMMAFGRKGQPFPVSHETKTEEGRNIGGKEAWKKIAPHRTSSERETKSVENESVDERENTENYQTKSKAMQTSAFEFIPSFIN